MAEETSPIDREPKTLQAGVEDHNASLADKLETLGDVLPRRLFFGLFLRTGATRSTSILTHGRP